MKKFYQFFSGYFEKILNQLSNYANFSLKAQTLLYSEFDSHPVAVTRSSSADEVFFYLKPSDLSIMTNHIGTRLGSRISDSSALEFIVYVPTKSPMYIISDPKNRNCLHFYLNFLKCINCFYFTFSHDLFTNKFISSA